MGRKTLTVTYHMERKNETAESCIDLPVDDVLVDIVLKTGCKEPASMKKVADMNPGELAVWAVWEVVRALAYLQLYTHPTIVDIRVANPEEAPT